MMIAHRGIVSRFFYSEYCQYEHPLSGSAWHRLLDLDDNGDCSGRVGTLSENAGLIFPVGAMKSACPTFRAYSVTSTVEATIIGLFLHEQFKCSTLTISKQLCSSILLKKKKPRLCSAESSTQTGHKKERPSTCMS